MSAIRVTGMPSVEGGDGIKRPGSKEVADWICVVASNVVGAAAAEYVTEVLLLDVKVVRALTSTGAATALVLRPEPSCGRGGGDSDGGGGASLGGGTLGAC